MALVQHRAGDPRLLGEAGPHGPAAMMDPAGAGLPGSGLGQALHGAASLQVVGPAKPDFMDSRKRADALAATRTRAAVVHPDLAGHVPPGTAARPEQV